jgi:hypothetical protein
MRNLDQIMSALEGSTNTIPGEHPVESIFPKEERGKKLYTEDLIIKLNEAIQVADGKQIELLCLISGLDGIDKRFTAVFCKLLKEEWHYTHEDIVTMLAEIKDPSSVTCLFEMSLRIPNYDDARSLAKKCIWALRAIGTLEARTKLELLSKSDDKLIRKEAKFAIEVL